MPMRMVILKKQEVTGAGWPKTCTLWWEYEVLLLLKNQAISPKGKPRITLGCSNSVSESVPGKQT